MPGLDKFYTQDHVAKQCFEFLHSQLNISENAIYLEPSAGAGSFINLLSHYIALDIAPEDDRIKKQDYLKYEVDKENFITIGNPPFGNRSKLAIDFFNKAATMSDVIAFIVPVSFMKWSVQKNLSSNFALYNYLYLEPESFTSNGKPYSIRTVFQIWVKKGSQYDNGINLRLTKQPPISHEDFKIWQYNATPESVKYIEEDWKYATYRQGYHDYNQIFTRENYDYIKEKMTADKKKQQFFFIKPLTEEAENLILNMDFNALAERNTATPGFGKGDFVSYYIERKNKI
jgi:hypothetical protein